jgi:hypothetical protein
MIFTIAELIELHILRPTPQARPRRRRALHLRFQPPPRPLLWSGEKGLDLTIQVWRASGKFWGYCRPAGRQEVFG